MLDMVSTKNKKERLEQRKREKTAQNDIFGGRCTTRKECLKSNPALAKPHRYWAFDANIKYENCHREWVFSKKLAVLVVPPATLSVWIPVSLIMPFLQGNFVI